MGKTTEVHVYAPCILAFLSQSEKIYWDMHSKVLGQFKVAHHPVFSRSTNLESKLIDFFVLLKL